MNSHTGAAQSEGMTGPRGPGGIRQPTMSVAAASTTEKGGAGPTPSPGAAAPPCPYGSGMDVEACHRSDLCDCFDHPELDHLREAEVLASSYDLALAVLEEARAEGNDLDCEECGGVIRADDPLRTNENARPVCARCDRLERDR